MSHYPNNTHISWDGHRMAVVFSYPEGIHFNFYCHVTDSDKVVMTMDEKSDLTLLNRLSHEDFVVESFCEIVEHLVSIGDWFEADRKLRNILGGS